MNKASASLIEIIDNRIATTKTQYAATVTTIFDDNRHAIVKFPENDSEFDFLNKTGEKLGIGDSVYIYANDGNLTNGVISYRFGAPNEDLITGGSFINGFPGDPVDGQIHFFDDTQEIWRLTKGEWERYSRGKNTTKITYGNTTPESPITGDAWIGDGATSQTVKKPYKSYEGTKWDRIFFETSEDQLKEAIQSLGSTGYRKLPSGLIIQWGVNQTNTGEVGYGYFSITLPIAFPTARVGTYLELSTPDDSEWVMNAPVLLNASSNLSTIKAVGNIAKMDKVINLNWLSIGY